MAATVFPVLAAALGACTPQQTPQPRLANLSHLNSLYEDIKIDGRPMAIIHIYSEYPDYQWVDDSDEGIACVDDAARAAVVYLRHFELTGDSANLRRCRSLIEFCRYMQADDGLFYNFIFPDHAINRDGPTSRKSLGWWTARGVWALAEGYRIFRDRDPAYAGLLQQHLHKTFGHLDTLLQRHPTIDTIKGFPAPRWLLHNAAGDATSELVLGLAAYYRATAEPRVKAYLEKFGEAFVAMQAGDRNHFPFGAILSWQNVWHGWANGQTQALATIAALLQREDFLAAARREAEFFYPYLQQQGFPREMEFRRDGNRVHAVKIDRFPQIAYALRPMIVGALRVAESTGDPRFAVRAAELAQWFFGENAAGAHMYDPPTGRGFDGILSEKDINRNAGAESTIEALYTMLELEANPVARRKLWERSAARQPPAAAQKHTGRAAPGKML
ncbi:MAG: glycoside hydrolase family 9 protein [candidate division KSB1 bacterium]|nr:glycoside hydrolase family 9 protein [candidate division KSB1 bacterium]MDZ7273524.1 glycoside hydrolase family 9 protein [candidate division KSB1 bacterium]MDZ7286885.1 glycoside hydrolase family 9 protein [candidate division KSB1 bacterium]MDZ7299762.1 glycoside hydrolase family 9 protein [candidate division KSB1 bacterium]MDZ7350661.1 glycoside hydrolase family 9 protein [candidate division KSB1 bacterium]